MGTLTHALAAAQNGWAAFSWISALVGLSGLGLVALALFGLALLPGIVTAFVPGWLRHGLITLGVALMVGAALYQAGSAKGAHDAFALDQARAIEAEQARTAVAQKLAADLAAQAAADLAALQADQSHLKDLLDDARKRADAARVCIPRDLSGRLRRL